MPMRENDNTDEKSQRTTQYAERDSRGPNAAREMFENLPTQKASIVLHHPGSERTTAKPAHHVERAPVALDSLFRGAGHEKSTKYDGQEPFENVLERYRGRSEHPEYEEEEGCFEPSEAERKLMLALNCVLMKRRTEHPDAEPGASRLKSRNGQQTRLPTSFWLGDHVVGDGLDWMASQLPTWTFSFENSYPFLAEYSHLAAPILESLVEAGVLKEKSGDFTMTQFGVSLRRVWHDMKDRSIRLQFPRTYVWPYRDDYVPDSPLDLLVATYLNQETGFHQVIENALKERNGPMHPLDAAGRLYFLQKALQLWCDGQDNFLRDIDLGQILSFAPPRFLAMLQRSRNGCPVYPGLAAAPVRPVKQVGLFMRYIKEVKLPDDWKLM